MALGSAPSLAQTNTAANANVYQGVYVIDNTYNNSTLASTGNAGLAELDSAAAASCTASPPSIAVLRCIAEHVHRDSASKRSFPANTVVWLRVQSARNASSCHYLVAESGYETPAPVNESGCDTSTNLKYDTCIKNSAGTKGILDQALQDIVTIDANLAAAGLPPLKLAVGLQPGATTPVSYLLDSSVDRSRRVAKSRWRLFHIMCETTGAMGDDLHQIVRGSHQGPHQPYHLLQQRRAQR